jgi:hypothetical protein
MNILGTVVEGRDVYKGYSCYAVFEKCGKIYRTVETEISASYMYDLAIYDKEKIDEMIFEYCYDLGDVREMDSNYMKSVSDKIPSLKYYIRNNIIGDLLID